MKKLVCLIMSLLIITGCVHKEEIKSGALIPYEKPELPVVYEQIEYAQRSSDFRSVFHLNAQNVNAGLNQELKKEVLNVSEWSNGTVEYQTYSLAFCLDQTYRVSVDITNNVASSVTVRWETYGRILSEQTFGLSDGFQHLDVEYTHTESDVYDGTLVLAFHKGNSNSGQIILDNLKIDRTNGIDHNVKVNQVGYLPESQKLAIFRQNSGDWFDVIRVDTNEVVYTGQILGVFNNEDTGEVNSYGDFSSVTEPGTYRIVSQICGQSYDFQIQEGLYDSLLVDALNMLTLQRCGQTLTEDTVGLFAHEACHKSEARGYSSWEMMDVTGGWHDAGDYGRYTLTAVKTINDLLMSYYVYPDSFTDDMNLPESGNGIPDVLDEAKVGLEWLKKMQIEWGPVYTAAVTTQFAGFVSAEQDLQELWVLDYENTSTASSAGAFALASMMFESWDKELALDYLDRAKVAYEFALSAQGEAEKKNPKEISAGDYENPDDLDEIYFMTATLYTATHEQVYLDALKDMLIEMPDYLFGLSYNEFGGYGSYLLLKDSEFIKTEYYVLLYNQFMKHAQDLVWDNVHDGYQLTIDSYHWGANMNVANDAMMMLMANDVKASSSLVDAAFEQLSYLLGKNSINMSFVTGYGTAYPRNIHHRMTETRDIEMMGALVGGPDGSADSSLPVAKKYWDDAQMYTTNEVAIYYNSPLIFVLSAFQ